MVIITIQDLQNIAVKSTSDFFNSSIPLNQSLAKQASEMGLNSEQLKRAVEATNTLTHLKSVELSTDRTVEFPVADYREIVKMAFVPNVAGSNPDDLDNDSFGLVEKTASVDSAESALAYTAPELTQEETIAFLQKQAAINKRALEEARIDREVVGLDLLQKLAEIRRDPELTEHLSYACGSKDTFVKVASVIAPGAEFRELPEGMFKSAQLKGVNSVLGLFKKAQELTVEIARRQELDSAWEEIRPDLVKQAVSLKPIATALGAGITKVKGLFMKAPASATKPLDKSLLEKGMHGVGNAAGRTLTSPFRATGSAISSTTSTLAGVVGKKINNAAASTALGKAVGITEKPINPKTIKRIRLTATGAATLGAAALDASLFEPEVNPAGDKSGRVWNALQN